MIFDCWLDNSELVAWMKKTGLQNGGDVEQYFETKYVFISLPSFYYFILLLF